MMQAVLGVFGETVAPPMHRNFTDGRISCSQIEGSPSQYCPGVLDSDLRST